jgi:hypothetical protein
MPTAEDLFSETFGRFMKNWTFIISLRQFADVAFPLAEEALSAVHFDFIDRIAVNPDYKNVIVKADGSESGWDKALRVLSEPA